MEVIHLSCFYTARRRLIGENGFMSDPASPNCLEESEKLARSFMWSTATQRCVSVECVLMWTRVCAA